MSDNKNFNNDDLLDILLDPDNRAPIVLSDGNGKNYSFEQVAVIPLDREDEEQDLYCVLKPLDKLEGIADDEAIVFAVDFDDDYNAFSVHVEEDNVIAQKVFDKYYELLRNAAEEKRRK
ncbi:MAG: hypothetical protein J5713_03680 [Clostridia bacterium]|nr:hypothetical protein [Clostridia bacterium]